MVGEGSSQTQCYESINVLYPLFFMILPPYRLFDPEDQKASSYLKIFSRGTFPDGRVYQGGQMSF